MKRLWDSTPWGVSAFLVFGLSALSGVGLLLRYRANPYVAHGEVAAMPGWLRGVHAWAATAFLILLMLHLGRAGAEGWRTKAARAGWLAGIASLGLTLGAFLTGSILAWDHRGWQALLHVHDVAQAAGWNAFDASTPEAAPLGAILLLHVAGFGLAAGAALALHLWARHHGEDLVACARESLRGARGLALGTAAGVLLLAVLRPPIPGPPPQTAIQGGHPEWPFLWLVPLEDLWGVQAVWILPALLALLAAAPWLAGRWRPRSRAWTGVLLAAALLALTLATLR